jgi:L-ascorbate metabolism protein UlaG (beta-lactamase superfamily)
MTISWFGQSFFRIESQGRTIVIDPFSKGSPAWATRVPRIKADVVFISHEHADHNNAEAIEGSPLVFRGPGEYEFQGIFVEGIPSFHDANFGKDRGPNTMFVIASESIRLAHLGDFGEAKLNAEQLERLDEIDILILPIGGTYTIDPKQASAVVNQIEPKIVIPMHYRVSASDRALAEPTAFIKEFGTKPSVEEKLSFRKKELEGEKIRLVLLKPLAVSQS